jgi:hypothetical protein
MPQAFYILFGALFTVAVCLAAGRLLLRGLGIRFYRQEETPLAFVCGAALAGTLAFAFCALHIVYKGVFLAAGVLLIAAAWRWRALRLSAESLPPLPRAPVLAACALMAPHFLLTFFHAMAPEHSPDGSTYHLGLVARYYREHGFPWITTNIYANLSQGVEMLFLWAYAFGRHSAAALVHFAFLPALAWMIFNLGRRCGFPWAGLAAGVIVFVSPVFAIDAASAYVDVATAAVVFALFYLLEVWDKTRNHALLVPVGLLAGFAYACKYTAFVAVPFAVGWILWRLWRTPRCAWRPLLTVCGLALAMILPWMLKNWLIAGNPFSPFLNRWFPNPYVTVAWEEDYRAGMRKYPGLERYWQIPLEVTVRGQVLAGLLGPLFLLAPAGLLALQRPMGRRFWLAACVFGATYVANVGTRFLIPAAPFLALALALALERWRWALATLVIAHTASAWPGVMKLYCDRYAWRLDEFLVKPALRLESEEDFLARKWPPYLTARTLENMVPGDGKVFAFNQVSEAYTSREVIVRYQSALGHWLGDILWIPLVPDFQPVRLHVFHFPESRVRKLRLLQTAAGSEDQWIVSEFRLWRGETELERSSDWRLRAWPNPWGVQYAFDNSPLTAWVSGERIRPGMYLEIDLGKEQVFDRITVQTPRRFLAPQMRVEACEPSGVCALLENSAANLEIPPPSRLRRKAVQELKLAGITHLLVHEGDFGSEDFRDAWEHWGLSPVAESPGAVLYRID